MTEPDRPADRSPEFPERGPVHEYADGEIRSYEGYVNYWLLAVYAVLGIWALYYVWQHWGGLGPGLAR